MLLEGLPHAAKEGSGHRFQKEFVTLAGNALESSKRSVADELGSIEADLGAAEAALAAIGQTEAAAARASEVAAERLAAAEATAAGAAEAVLAAAAKHASAEQGSATFFMQRQEEQQERSRVAAVVEGPLRALVDGGCVDEEGQAGAVEAVEGLLGQIGADKVVIAAAPHALTEKPDSRCRFDTMVIDAATKSLTDHLAGIESSLQASEADEVNQKAEILGLWAIADCARDSSADAKASVAKAQEEQQLAEIELHAGQKRAKAQRQELEERSNKRVRVLARLAEVDEAVAAAARLLEGPVPASEGNVAEVPVA